MSAFLTTVLLVSLLVLLVLLLGVASPQPKPRESPATRVEQCVRALDQPDPDVRADSHRRLLSMGASAIPPLLHCLEQADRALSPAQQRGVEGVLFDFGPQILTFVSRFYQRAHRATHTFPSLSRVLQALPTHTLLPHLASLPLPLLAAHLGVARLGGCEGLAPSLTARLAVACLPRLAARAEVSMGLEGAIKGLQSRWCPPELPAVDPPLRASPASLDEDLGGFDAAAPNPSLSLLLRLSRHLADPRAQERLIRHVQAGVETSAFAFEHLASQRVRDLQPLLNTILRQSAPLSAAQMLALKRAVRSHPEPCTQTRARSPNGRLY